VYVLLQCYYSYYCVRLGCPARVPPSPAAFSIAPPRGVGPCALKQLGAAFPQSAKRTAQLFRTVSVGPLLETNRMSLPRQVVSRGDTQNIRNFQRLPSRPMQQPGCRILSMDAYDDLMYVRHHLNVIVTCLHLASSMSIIQVHATLHDCL
jgi:hypothetical protein